MDESNFMIACERAWHLAPYWLLCVLCAGGLTRLTFKNFITGAFVGYLGFPMLVVLF